MENRRNDRRLLLPDLQIRVKKQSRGDRTSFVDCTPVDISFNGLAFSSDQLILELLQKIEIQLSVGRRTLEGSAVVCHVAATGKSVRYGILYIDINPSLEELFSLKTLSSGQIKEFAENLADNAMTDHSMNEEQLQLKKAQVLLFDGVEAFKNRICQRAEYNAGRNGKTHLSDLFEFSADMSSVTIPIIAPDGRSVLRNTITPKLDEIKNHVYFESDHDKHFATLVDVLQELGDTFEVLLRKN